ncbi:hypothetical protein CA54_11630 [Symmachiella macrocystis]|uniref:Uncharacterized protein n=1 Tax=Symmachiella macrocystis TaxID=2527985 RepID=A0A5C6BMK6_9PLAN|nr:hypothetical protein CA54_11630 [Symmachiella macrocystis]
MKAAGRDDKLLDKAVNSRAADERSRLAESRPQHNVRVFKLLDRHNQNPTPTLR